MYAKAAEVVKSEVSNPQPTNAICNFDAVVEVLARNPHWTAGAIGASSKSIHYSNILHVSIVLY